jgi:SagB-type dehydrogenase family enzyme
MYRRASAVAAFWTPDGCRVRNYARGTSVTLTAIGLAILNAAPKWQTRTEITNSLASVDESDVDRAISDLTAAGILETSILPLSPRELALESWQGWNPTAALFHLDTRDLKYSTREDAVEGLPDRTLARRCPLRDEEDPIDQLKLPTYPRRGAFPSVLLERRSWRRFGSQPLTKRELSALLGLTWGTQRWAHHPANFDLRLKTSPSPGATHSIEAYACVRRVSGVPPGLYRYLSDSHGLACISEAWSDEELIAKLGKQEWIAGAAAVFFLSSRFERVQWKYPHPRTYRSLLIEAGHFCQTFCLVATWLGLAPFCTAALADSAIEQSFGLDGISEAVLYAAGVGSRPPGVKWAPVPDGPSPRTTLSTHLSSKRWEGEQQRAKGKKRGK